MLRLMPPTRRTGERHDRLDARHCVLPTDGTNGTLVGRVWRPDVEGPAVVAVRDDGVFDVTAAFPTVQRRRARQRRSRRRAARRPRASASAISPRILANTPPDDRDIRQALAPGSASTCRR